MSQTLRNRLVAAAAPLLLASAAFAQSAPTPRATDSPPVWIFYLVAAVLLGATVGINAIPSKRGHLD